MTVFPLMLVLPLLAAAAVTDLRLLRIPNVLPAAVVTVFVLVVLLSPPPDLSARLAIAAATFAVGFLAFTFRLVGGGDVKMLAALMLFIPAASALLFANIFAASLLVGVGLLGALRRIDVPAVHGWRGLSEPRKFPMGISIAMAGFAHCAALHIPTA